MSIIKSAYLVPSSALAVLHPQSGPMQPLIEGLAKARESLAEAAPDTVLVYSSRWLAVVDQQWLTRPHMTGRYVDPTFHDLGHIDWEIGVDLPVTERAIPMTSDFGVRSRGVNYDEFPIDPGTIVFSKTVNTGGIPMVVTTNNLYHDWETTKKLGAAAVAAAEAEGRTVSVAVIGGLSGSFFRDGIAPEDDHIHSDREDQENRELLETIVSGDVAQAERLVLEYGRPYRADFGMKHLAFLHGALDGKYSKAEVHGYGPLMGSGAAVVEFTP